MADQGGSGMESFDHRDKPRTWKVLLVADEQGVHDVTRLCLGDVRFDGRAVEFLHAFSAGQACEIYERNPDIALSVIDVVMETDDAGLRVVRHVREVLGNVATRLILRTGQPLAVPARSLILQYDINDYKTKTELTSAALFATVITALRGYREIAAMEYSASWMRHMADAAIAMRSAASLGEVAELVLAQLQRLVGLDGRAGSEPGPEGVFVTGLSKESPAGRVLAATNAYRHCVGRQIQDGEPGLAPHVLAARMTSIDDRSVTIRIGMPGEESFVAHVKTNRAITPNEWSMIEFLRLKSGEILAHMQARLRERRQLADIYFPAVADRQRRISTRV